MCNDRVECGVDDMTTIPTTTSNAGKPPNVVANLARLTALLQHKKAQARRFPEPTTKKLLIIDDVRILQ